ncbi:MAG: BON domain-containing protein [Deltaproteobacteria bacterium]|nr:BON domain-containing protein [Deltaproteobacteria bacterium]
MEKCRLVFVGLLAALALTAPAEAFLPYRMMLEAAKSPEKPMELVQDKRLRTQLREALLVADPDGVLSISPYVFLGHAFLVGWVDSPAERMKLVDAARGVGGLRSLDVYLPEKPANVSTSADEELKLKVEEAITLESSAQRMNVSIQVLAGHVVLLGAVRSGEEIQSADAAARAVPGVTGITSYLLVPAPGQEKMLEGLLP